MTSRLTPGTAADLLALGAVAAHAAVPWLLRSARSRDRLRHYDRATMLLALCAAAAVASGTAPGTAWPVPFTAGPPWHPAMALVAAVAGAALPWTAARCGGRVLRRRAARPGTALGSRIANAAHLAGCAAGEEMLWRLVGPLALTAVGAPPALAAAACLTGFCLLHPPNSGWRSLPYVAVAAGLFTAAAALGGLPAAILAHIAHNTVLACCTSVPRETTGAEAGATAGEVPRLPAPNTWD
ncbi:type II CAAX prenyl endopeptidase Rce1 family protein [Streptomyces sp. NPDC052013]|uniref:CPBP family glutamic-type intramembrane protease n=1 Tax=Streptomyces sp. NPDC052013 TaxID=3365679 RepID=UPI0037CE34F2